MLTGCEETEDPRLVQLGFCDCDAADGECDFIYYDAIDPSFEFGTPYRRRRNLKGDLKRKVKTKPREVDCMDDPNYEDNYGYCDCWDDAGGNSVCGYWEYCEHHDTDECVLRPKSTLPSTKRLRRALIDTNAKIPEFDCNKMGSTWKTAKGFCECNAQTFTCDWYNYEDMLQKCYAEPAFRMQSGGCFPDENGRHAWYMFEQDVSQDSILNPSTEDLEDAYY